MEETHTFLGADAQYKDSKCNAHSFLQLKKAVILMLMQVAFYCMNIIFLSQMKETHTFWGADAQYKALQGEHTLH